ncbi:unnamed protein product [Hermetia illucens]|uniref:Cytochrome P450 n=1 Tax=Hermetia illucens TaxID=343691 RepID=A0A7R8UV05_HERIL|nr:cytochrome P450 4d2-like [Hermetia illucens]XP_037918305.1 cytochrome P450 4d2-like [Hermetia illucens]XP_037918306.1 cytochrome P450 4d2-like [Hermetia illucens]XP_037918307.1 cytochrome P450 4d2-like [Hermetia illucens]XP_037918308.1 cytochrome P450 4d2-like [Hermetia illucens]XP_037918309.1 cytochrome P450 4d2-like [Hermetia illucens]XP_037918310.1 cytochrome P450 4d2-like [Hermetia illucens]XP_037918311.1 cytochrome P450 4d2-like [Hermetia illucens]XP_037918312.1 cytochrome P450 4d2-
MEDSVKFMRDLSLKYGPVTRTWIVHKLAFIIRKPELLETILTSTKYITKSSLYDFLDLWLGDGLLLSTGSKWHSRRKIITPAFHFKILEDFVEIFDRQSKILAKKLVKHADGKEFNIYPYVTLAALDVVCETAMGTKIDAQTDPDCEYVRAVAEVTTILTNRFINIWYRSDFIFKIFAPEMKKRQDHVIDLLHNFTESIIEDRRKSLLAEQADEEIENNDDVGTKKKLALLDVLLQSTVDGKPLTNADIREEVDTFMFEGHDTTTSAMSFTLYCLSRHPEVQNRAFQEICAVIGTDKNKPVTYRDLQDLKYLECVIKESMRLYPSVPIIGRKMIEDTKIGDYIFPADSNVNVPIYVILKDPKLFPEPEKFDPDRHLLENSNDKTNPYSYIPFSAGPRNCIGQKFAMLEMKSTVSKMLRYYELLPMGPEPIPVINLVLRSANGIHIGIKERQY